MSRLKIINGIYSDELIPGNIIKVPMPIDTTIIKDLDSTSHTACDITKAKTEEGKQISQTDPLQKPTNTSIAVQEEEKIHKAPILYLGKYQEMSMSECIGKEIQYIVKLFATASIIRSQHIN